MQRAELVLTNLRKTSQRKEEYEFTRLYRNLFNPDFYLNAYAKLSPREGNMTKGTDANTIDGFGKTRVARLIREMRKEQYRPRPVRRTYIPKKNGKLRPLGIPSFDDKLIQEIVREILEAIYEPIFSENSHGFRPGRSCHTALQQVRKTGNGTSWVIEGDIKGFFDNIDHGIMLRILSRRIKDGRFINLVRRLLKSGIMEEGKIRDSLSGAPQGGVVSPILSNIYLHELDRYMAAVSKRETKGTSRKVNPEYRKLYFRKYRRIQAGKSEEAKEIRFILRHIPSYDMTDPDYRRVRYVRYADDFIVLIIGPKTMAARIKEELALFLQCELKVELSDEKTLITNPLADRFRFLGYDISKGKDDTCVKKDQRGFKRKSLNGVMQLLVPGDVINDKIKPFSRNGKPFHRTDRMNLKIETTIKRYSDEIRGLYYYYCLAGNVSKQLYRFQYYHYYSLAMTIAAKHKLSLRKTLRKFAIDVRRKQGAGTYRKIGVTYKTKRGTTVLTYFNEPIRRMVCPPRSLIKHFESHFNHKNELIRRLSYGQCEGCGHRKSVDDIEVHHIRKLKELKKKFDDPAQAPVWVRTMIKNRRKTLVLCKACHKDIHKKYNHLC